MDANQFDSFVRRLAGATSRRRMLGRAAGGAGGGLLGLLGAGAIAVDAQDDDRDDRERDRARRGATATAAPTAPALQEVTVQQTATEAAAVGPEAQCRPPGEACGPDQICCDGQPCEVGKDGASRCGGVPAPVETCTDACEATEVTVVRAPAYRVEVDCRYDDGDDRTTCDCAANAAEGDAPPVRRVTLGQADVCAEVVAGDFELQGPSVRRPVVRGENSVRSENTITNDNSVRGDASAGNGGTSNAEASGGQVTVNGGDTVAVDASGGTANSDASGGDGNSAVVSSGGGGGTIDSGGNTLGNSGSINVPVVGGGGRSSRFVSQRERNVLSLTFAGRVEATGTATYWCETERGLVPAIGPALARAQDEVSADAGAIVVRALSCDLDGAPDEAYDWYGRCQRPAKTTLRLRAVEGGQVVERANAKTDDAGRRSFGQLAAGTYRIAPEGNSFCHAECDSVDENGDVLVQAGQHATVYVFHCGRRS